MKRLSLILAGLAALVVAALGDWTIGVVGNVVQVEGNAIQAGGAAWTPDQIDDLALWLDATTGITTDGTSVTNWADRSAAGNDAEKVSTATTWPTVGNEQLNGVDTIYFDGGDYLLTGFLSATGTTFFAVARMVGGETIAGARDSENQRSFWGCPNGRTEYRAGVGTDSAIISDFKWGTVYRVFGGKYNTATVSLYNSGTNIYNKAQSGSGENTTTGYMIGALNSAGSPIIPGQFHLAEILAYRRALSEAEILQVGRYLAEKWGIE